MAEGVLWVEKALVEEMYRLVDGITISGHGDDAWIWAEDISNSFTVRSSYEASHRLRVGSQEKDIFISLWNMEDQSATIRILFFWRVFLDRFPSKDNLIKRNIDLEDDNGSCPLCHELAKTLTSYSLHLLSCCIQYRYNVLGVLSEKALIWLVTRQLVGNRLECHR